MHGGNSSEDEPMAEMNLIPLIDIALTLLIIMMVTTAFVRKPGVSLKLPETVTREGAAEMSKDLTVFIASDGGLFMNGMPQSDAQVQQRMIQAAQASKITHADPRVLIKGDRNVVYSRVMAVMDLVRMAGLSKVVLPTDPKIGQAVPVPSDSAAPVRAGAPPAGTPDAGGASAPAASGANPALQGDAAGTGSPSNTPPAPPATATTGG